jgi:N-acetylglucosaminyldiphosphoundecaprenol N-acetyl-beta-D-mannosaminyltransferase
MLAIVRLAAKQNRRIFLLGGSPGIAQLAGRKLAKQYPGLKAGWSSGAEDISQETDPERNAVIKKINSFQPDLLFVAYGAPWQELWISHNLSMLKVKVAMSIGGSLDYISGRLQRAPSWLRQLHLEWLFRLIQEPWRLGRQLSLLKFVWQVYNSR